jgi:hypothetical protein
LENIDLGRIAYNQIADGITVDNLAFNPNKFLSVADNTGTIQFSAESVDDNIQFMGGGRRR